MIRSCMTAMAGLLCLAQGIGQDRVNTHRMSKDEQVTMSEYLASRSTRNVPNPPPGPVRTMAEWEEIQAFIITWAGQNTILREIVRNAVKECRVFILTSNPTTVENTLTNAGIPLDSVTFLNEEYNTIWVRDYGPWAVYKNDVDSLYIVDWIYNRPREDDDRVPVVIAEHMGLPIYEAVNDPEDWVHTGGNNLPDGMGTLFSSELVLEENEDKTEGEIDSIAYKYLGIKQYIKLPTLPYDGIHHLDMHMRIIDEETILIGEYPDGVSDGPQIEANIRYLRDSVRTSFGNPYKIIRLPMPPDASGRYPQNGGQYRTYTNSVFVNKTILVPTYEERYDTTALRIYRENLPGYNVVGINCNNIIGQLGALHCITKSVGVAEPLLIAHARLRDVRDTVAEYPLSAFIRHRDGIASASVFYRLAGDSVYMEVPMILRDSLGHNWSAVIPGQAADAEVEYYIQATASTGKTQVRPIVAPEGYFRFNVFGEPANQPPLVEITDPADGSIIDLTEESVTVSIDATDDDGEIIRTRLFINGEESASAGTLANAFDWTLTEAGDFKLYAIVMDDDSVEVTSDTISVTVEAITSGSDLTTASIRIYPNPADDVVWIETAEPIDYDIHVLNSIGQRIHISPEQSANQVKVDLSSFPAGMYFMLVGEETVKVILR